MKRLLLRKTIVSDGATGGAAVVSEPVLLPKTFQRSLSAPTSSEEPSLSSSPSSALFSSSSSSSSSAQSLSSTPSQTAAAAPSGVRTRPHRAATTIGFTHYTTGTTSTSATSPGFSATSEVPPLWLPLVRYLCDEVETRGKDKVGVFRTSASASVVRQLLKALACRRPTREEMEVLFQPFQSEVDVAASVLKAYLREQVEPLIPSYHYASFIRTSRITDVQERTQQLKELVAMIHGERRRILGRLMTALHLIQGNNEVNKMDSSNLAIVFCPLLLRSNNDELDLLQIQSQCLVLETMILHPPEIFGDAEHKDEDSVSQDDAPASSKAELGHPVQEHDFVRENFSILSSGTCVYCQKATGGLRKGYKCQRCQCTVHSKCRAQFPDQCSGQSQQNCIGRQV